MEDIAPMQIFLHFCGDWWGRGCDMNFRGHGVLCLTQN